MRLVIEYEYGMFIASAKNETATRLVIAVLVQTVQIVRR